jgi:protein-tyrosine phosphatase
MKRLTILAALLAGISPATAAVENANVQRTAEGLTIRWQAKGAVDVYAAADPAATVKQAKLIAKADADGMHSLPDDATARTYFLLKDRADGKVTRVAERLLPLEQGSNFRDLGGYPATGGKHVRWGKIYRSGAMPLLTEKDYAYLGTLGIGSIVDLRSIDEREMAPTKLDERINALYIVNDYSARDMSRPAAAAAPADGQAMMRSMPNLYRDMPVRFAPQLRAIFHQLLNDKDALAYNCSAGQDRTGVASGLILAALGVPRDVIIADYHLSTQYRRPDYEMPKINPADYPGNAFLEMYGKYFADPAMKKPRPLMTEDGKAYLSATFEEIDARWGSVENYLDKELGVDAVKLAALRAEYLE